jgi:hypothetical protein
MFYIEIFTGWNEIADICRQENSIKIIVMQNDIPNTRTAAINLLKTEHSH